jgi:two-component system invasion response regulator UvrY
MAIFEYRMLTAARLSAVLNLGRSSILIEVLLVSEHKMIAQMFQSGMTSYGIRTEVAAAPEELHTSYQEVKPVVVVLDISADSQGRSLEICRRFLEKNPEAKLVILGQYEGEFIIREFYSAGALAYVCKKDDTECLVKAIKRAAKGEDYYPEDIAQKLARIAHKGDPFPFLNGKEKEIFVLMAKGYSLTEIAKLINLSLSKVNQTSAKIKKNLGVERSWDLAKIALRHQMLRIDS